MRTILFGSLPDYNDAMRIFSGKAGKLPTSKEELRCSFCSRTQNEVGKLIAGPEVYICDECVHVCLDIIEEKYDNTEIISPGKACNKWTNDLSVIGPSVTCALCGMVTPQQSALLVKNRGVLCPACLGAVQAAVVARDEHNPQS